MVIEDEDGEDLTMANAVTTTFQNIENFYAKALVRPRPKDPRTYEVKKVIIDGGSCLHLITQEVATAMNVHIFELPLVNVSTACRDKIIL